MVDLSNKALEIGEVTTRKNACPRHSRVLNRKEVADEHFLNASNIQQSITAGQHLNLTVVEQLRLIESELRWCSKQ